MRVIQINAGPLAPLNVQGDTVQTGFFKTPRLGPVRVTKMGLEGDKRVYANGNPNRAVFFYQKHYYEYWRKELNREIPYAYFGENITFDGWSDDEFYFGDELQIGSVRLRITQPRHPCVKIGAKMGDRGFPLKYMRSLRLGFHCSVLEEGTIEQNDEIQLVTRPEKPFHLSDFTRPVFINQGDIEGLENILKCQELIPELRVYVERLIAKDSEKTQGWRDYRPLQVANVHAECDGVVSFELHDPTGLNLPPYDAGQFLTMQLDISGEQRRPVRTYTIAGRSANGKGYSFTVKREVRQDGTLGQVSSHLVDKIKSGDSISALPPRGHFIVEPGTRRVVLISAGIGITPMLAMFEHLKSDTLNREVIFIHGARNARQHALHRRVRDIASGWKNARTFVKYSQPTPGNADDARADGIGRIGIDDLKRLIPELEADFYICGPSTFIQDVVLKLVEQGVPKDRIRYEFFGNAVSLFKGEDDLPPGDPVLDSEGKPIMVTFAKTGVSAAWTENTTSLLILAERNGLRPPQLCRNGLCEACACRLDDGEVEYIGDILKAPPKGQVLICSARPTTNVMIDV